MNQVVLQFGGRNDAKAVKSAEVKKVAREGRIAVMAAIETGNFDRARVLLTEIEDQLPEFAEHLKLDIIEAYGLTL